MSKEGQSSNDEKRPGGRPYDLEERTAQFGEAIIRFARKIPVDRVTEPLIGQLVRAATSVGANYGEADDAGSKKEFLYRISVSKREARETKHFLRMIAIAVPDLAPEAREHWREAKELHLIFAAIHRRRPKGGKDEGRMSNEARIPNDEEHPLEERIVPDRSG